MMTPAEKQQLQPFLSSMQTYCAGRFLIDLPTLLVPDQSSFSATNVYTGHRDTETTIEAQPMSLAQFRMALDKRRSELTTTTTDLEKKPLLVNTIPLNGKDGVIFDRARNSASGLADRSYELWRFENGYTVRLITNHWDASKLNSNNLGTETNSPKVMQELMSFSKKIRGRQNTDIPKIAGTCFMNGFMAGPTVAHESPELSFHLNGFEDVTITIVTDNRYTPDVTTYDLIDEETKFGESIAKDKNGKFRIIRANMLKTKNNIELKEVIMELPTDESYLDDKNNEHYVQGNLFIAENYYTDKMNLPYIKVTLSNGQRSHINSIQNDSPLPLSQTISNVSSVKKKADLTKASLSEAQAIALWDAITATLRIRPDSI